MADTQPKAKPHAIVFAYPFQGHITPTINLSIKLASKGFAITFIQLEFFHQTMAKAHGLANDADFFAEARLSGLDVHYATISDGFAPEFDRRLNLREYWESMVLDFPARVDRLVADVIGSSEEAETAFLLIADSLYTWASDIAMKHSIVHVSLWTGSAATFAINYNLAVWEKDPSSYDGNSAAPPTATKDNNILQNLQEADAVMLFLLKIVEKAFNQVKKSDFVLCNTVQELEPETLSALNQNQATYAIGPINFFAEMTQNLVQKSLFRQSDCTKWLDSMPPDSVLYISFGSVSRIDNEEIREIAHGLLISKVNFIWVIKDDTLGPNETDVFPPGFLDHVGDRGLIIPWCNQDMVLSNRAVGGFLTHCGWNSVLESVWYCVPMICRPISLDQPMNRKLVVEDWKIGVDLCHDGGHVTRVEVANKIEILMKGEEFIALRQELKNASKKLKNALEIDGSSQRNFDQFVLDLKAKLYSTN